MKCQIIGIEPIKIKEDVLYCHTVLFEGSNGRTAGSVYLKEPLKLGDGVLGNRIYVSRGTIKSKITLENA